MKKKIILLLIIAFLIGFIIGFFINKWNITGKVIDIITSNKTKEYNQNLDSKDWRRHIPDGYKAPFDGIGENGEIIIFENEP